LYRWASISDLCFNCGDGNYSISTLRKKVNSENWDEAAEQILKWNKADGKVLAGLTKRRYAESILLTKPFK
jgi:GH24 family phage-related lysozyme (muramidase)